MRRCECRQDTRSRVQPLALPDYGEAFLRDALKARESLLCIARKSAKSAIVAVFLLGRLVGPIAFSGYRAGVVSVNREKAGELKRQMQEIAEGSGLDGLRFLRSPAPGRVESATGTVDILSADKSAGHASGFDESIVDELGLLHERDRELVNGMRTAISARDGRFIALSIMGDAPFTREMVERRGDPGVAVHLYQAPEDCALDDPESWHAANPGLKAGIKSLAYMRDEARRVLATPTDQASFRAYDLNLPQDPSREMILAPTDLQACFTDELPPRAGPVCLGLDCGEATSATAAFAVWPSTGRCESWMAFGDVPSLRERGQRDGARYDLMEHRGELRTYPGRVTPVAAFLADVADELNGCRVHKLAADGYKDSEVMDFLERAGLRWPFEFRRVGAGKDGGRDVRALQRLVLNAKFKMKESLSSRERSSKLVPAPRRQRQSRTGQGDQPRAHRCTECSRHRGRHRRADDGPQAEAAPAVLRRIGRMSRRRPGSRHHAKLNQRRWQLVRLKVFEAAGWRCQSCGRAGRLECDHVVPLHVDPHQDPYALDGLQALCAACHLEKSRRERAVPVPGRDEWRAFVAEIANS